VHGSDNLTSVDQPTLIFDFNMRTVKGPSVFLAQFVQDCPPYNSLTGLAEWAADKGFIAVQMPTNLPKIFDLAMAAKSQMYCDDVREKIARHGIEISELSTHLQGQCMAIHPAYETMLASFIPMHLRGNRQQQSEWASKQLSMAARASARLNLKACATFSGSLAWPYLYPWPQRPAGLIDTAFKELARRWHPVLDVYETYGIDLCFELHPGEDLFDGLSFERFLKWVNHHPRCHILYDPSHFILQQLDYLQFIDIYHERIRMFHVKDAEFKPNGKAGVYGGYADWIDRPGRFRSVGDGQIDFKAIFSKLSQYDYNGWAVLEWECCLKHSEVGALEGAEFIRKHIITTSKRLFDDFASSNIDSQQLHSMFGL
jgi:sugar phosphate isomerase/epimerase